MIAASGGYANGFFLMFDHLYVWELLEVIEIVVELNPDPTRVDLGKYL